MILLWSSCNLIGIMSTGVYKTNKDFEIFCEVLCMGLRIPTFSYESILQQEVGEPKAWNPRSMWWPWICMKRDIGQGRNLERQKIESKTGEDGLNWSPQKISLLREEFILYWITNWEVRGTFSMILNTYDPCNLKNNATCCASNSILMAGGLGWVVDWSWNLIGIIGVM